MEASIFMDKTIVPTSSDLVKALGESMHLWQEIRDYAFSQYPKAVEEWNFSGAKYGWSFRIKDKKRAIVYLLPRDGYFKVALVFGQKATDEIMASNIHESIKTELANARVYAEGRGIRISVNDNSLMKDFKSLIDIKLRN